MLTQRPLNKKSSKLQGYGFVLPALAILFVFVAFSFILIVGLSFFTVDMKLNGTMETAWNGLGNYTHMLEDEKFIAALKNTLRYAIIVVPIQTSIALFFAIILSQKIKFKNGFRLIYFIPTLTSSTALTLIFMFLFSVSGPVNNLLIATGVLQDPINFMQDARFAMNTIMVMNIWSSVPFYMTIFLAALTDVPESQYEAAAVDGLNAWTKFRKITFPAIRPIVTFVIIVGLVGCLQVFDQAFIVSNGSGGPANSTLTLSLLIYQYAFDPSIAAMGYAAALSVVLGALIFGGTQLVRYLNRNERL